MKYYDGHASHNNKQQESAMKYGYSDSKEVNNPNGTASTTNMVESLRDKQGDDYNKAFI